MYDHNTHTLPRGMRLRRGFATNPQQNRYAIFYHLNDAKKPETRQRRLERFVEMMKKGDKLH